MRLAADGAERDCACCEPLDDLDGRLDLVDRNGLGQGLEIEQAPERAEAALVTVGELREFAVRAGFVGPAGVLQLRDGVRVPHVVFPVAAPVVETAGVQVERRVDRDLGEGLRVTGQHIRLDGVGVNPADP